MTEGAPVLKLWTDGGAYTEDRHPDCPGGWAFLAELYRPGRGSHVVARRSGNEVWTTPARMELMAVTQALRFAYTHHPGVAAWVIADDKRIVRGSSGGPRDAELARLWADVDALVELEGQHVVFHWVKGHNGAPLNEWADRMASKARSRLVEAIKEGRDNGAYL